MREIKFRAWNNKSSKMWTPEVIYLKENKPGLIFHLGKKIEGWIYDCEIMQYTGLKDKNGVEIYEGDIVAWKSSLKLAKNDCVMKMETVNNYGQMMTRPVINSTSEVIGNIMENPELLK